MSGILQKLRPVATRLGVQPRSALQQQQRRGFADHAGEDAKVNFWEAPTEVSRWKEEHIVFAVLGAWGVGIYSAMKVFGGKKAPETAKA